MESRQRFPGDPPRLAGTHLHHPGQHLPVRRHLGQSGGRSGRAGRPRRLAIGPACRHRPLGGGGHSKPGRPQRVRPRHRFAARHRGPHHRRLPTPRPLRPAARPHTADPGRRTGHRRGSAALWMALVAAMLAGLWPVSLDTGAWLAGSDRLEAAAVNAAWVADRAPPATRMDRFLGALRADLPPGTCLTVQHYHVAMQRHGWRREPAVHAEVRWKIRWPVPWPGHPQAVITAKV
ncbi:protein of unknown function [Candidatus Hydrogenisulfobacillus filiaventi]|uniref:Uncharacterized protein n=1 Tax=Candidatus Hydrogenisulfobacillus filiaventi TaxID=2707344 RepID=A0A6F8ZFL3_9FIRM|nr:protein of unknown function [Candidatus Hydrogenisulfobacillus filiaventi]